MARRIQVQLIGLFALIAGLASTGGAQAPPPSSILVSYSFDDGVFDTGPDTFAIFQKAQGSVTLNAANRWSGYRSVELRDVAGDGDFPELQGYFAERTKGRLFLHFALMTTDPAEELNIALAGRGGFELWKNGIAVWFKTGDGYLYQVSDSIPKKLFRMNPFAWYVVDVSYDIDAGVYDLTIHAEGQQDALVNLSRQANASNQPGCTVDKFSFIGDPGTDQSNVVYYVDDVLAGLNESIVQSPFVAPGRRKLFVDYWNDAQHARSGRPEAIPATDLSDLGIGNDAAQVLKADGAWDAFVEIYQGRRPSVPENASPISREILEAVKEWADGKAALASDDPEAALKHFDRGRTLAPAGKIYALNAVIALVRLGRWDQADIRLNEIAPLWRNDLRFPVVLAQIGLARNDLANAEQLLTQVLRQATPSDAVAEEYFFVLLWKNEFAQAEAFAERAAENYRETPDTRLKWIERMGDAAFFAGNLPAALRSYEESSSLLKISDVYFRMGNPDKEREYRELVYGKLGVAR